MAPVADAHMHLLARGYHPELNASGSDVADPRPPGEAVHGGALRNSPALPGCGQRPRRRRLAGRQLETPGRPRCTGLVHATPQARPGLAELVRTYSGCQFLFSHVGQPGRYQSPPTKKIACERLSALLELSSAANCWTKISALYSISDRAKAYPCAEADPFVGVVLDTFGPSQCIWGSDFSPTLDHGTFEQAFIVPQLDQLSKTDIDRVMGANLLQLLTKDLRSSADCG